MTRRFTEAEIGSLFKRASERREEAPQSGDVTLSLEEIVQFASEIGIDPEQVRAAAVGETHDFAPPQVVDEEDAFELTAEDEEDEFESESDENDQPEPSGESRFKVDPYELSTLLGGPFHIDVKRVAEGHLSEERWAGIVRELPVLMGQNGSEDSLGGTREWTARTGFEETYIALTPAEDQVTIRARSDYQTLAAAMYAAAILGTSGMAATLLSGSILPTTLTVTLFMGALAGAVFAGRTAVLYWSGKQLERMNGAANRLQAVVSGSVEVEPLEPKVKIVIVDAQESGGSEGQSAQSRDRSLE